MQEKCKIFLVGIGNSKDEVSEEITKFLGQPGIKITRVLQSSAPWQDIQGHTGPGTHITIFYTQES